MCGIISYVGTEHALPLLLEGLKRLEYRGYDSAGMALANGSPAHVMRRVGTVAEFAASVDPTLPHRAGIAHTRWATHGAVSEGNAHPQTDCTRTVFVVHNGIIENGEELRAALTRRGHRFTGDTDTEVVPHLVEEFCAGIDPLRAPTLVGAGRDLLKQLKGAFSLVVLHTRQPNLLLAVRRECPLLLGIGASGRFVASDPSAFADSTRTVVELPDSSFAILRADGHAIHTADGTTLELPPVELPPELARPDRAGYPHFMLKEIHEQPAVLRSTLKDRLGPAASMIEPIDPRDPPNLARDRFDRVVLIACGTSYHAALIGERLLGKLWGLPTVARLGSEARYSPWEFTPRTLAIVLSQSGETADTTGALMVARKQGATTLGIVNETQTVIGRGVHGLVPIRVGPERGVASTKAFTAQVVALSLLALHITKDRIGRHAAEIRRALRKLPDQIATVLALESEVRRLAVEITKYRNALYLGRGYNLATALEGALKLKEVSYIHAEGMTSAEMKHGPIALIEEQMPVIVLAPADNDEFTIEKILSNVREVHTRSSNLTVVASEGDDRFAPFARHLLKIPRTLAHLTPVLATVALQLLAYHVAVLRGFNPDQPRHLAKAVTVE